MKKKQLLSGIVIAVVLVVLIAAVVYYVFGGQLVKGAVETIGSDTLGVPVTVDNVGISLMKGTVSVEGLGIANPEGYNHESLLNLDEAFVAASLGSLMGEQVRVNQIKLDGMKITIEQKGLTNNLQEILKNVKAKQPKEDEAAKKDSKAFVVDKLEITNAEVKVKLLPVPGKVDTIPLKLSTITMENLGTDSKLSLAELMSKILIAITAGIAEQGVGILPDDLTKGLESGLKGVMDIGARGLEEGKKVLDEGTKILDAGKDAGEGLLKGVEGIFKKKEE